MKYAILIYGDESKAGDQEDLSPWIEYTKALEQAGVLRGGEALEPTSAAITVRIVDGRVETSDGPFDETKEQFGGFYLIDCDSLDDAISWAAKVPSASRGPVEVRPVTQFEN